MGKINTSDKIML